MLKSINPRFKVGALGPDVLQANTLGHLRAYRRLQVIVLGELGDDSLRWSGLLPVVDQFRGLDVIDDFLQSGDLGICMVEEKSEVGHTAKQMGFKFM